MNPSPANGRQAESLSVAETSAEPAGHPSLRVPVAARGVGIVILATVGLVWLLSWAQILPPMLWKISGYVPVESRNI